MATGVLQKDSFEWPPDVPPPGVTWQHPARSLCFGCKRVIPWWQNVPILAWLALRGRCAQCGAWFGWRTLMVETATPLLWLAVWHGAAPPKGTNGMQWAPALVGLVLVSSWVLAVPLALEKRQGSNRWMIGGLGMATVGWIFFWA